MDLQIEVESKEAAAKIIQNFREFKSVASVSTTGFSSELDDNANETLQFNISILYNIDSNTETTDAQ